MTYPTNVTKSNLFETKEKMLKKFIGLSTLSLLLGVNLIGVNLISNSASAQIPNPVKATADVVNAVIGVLEKINSSRSVILEVDNNTNLTLNRTSDKHKHGGFATTPKSQVLPKTAEVFGSQSKGGSLFTGTEGSVTYKGDGFDLTVSWNNPWAGGNSCNASLTGANANLYLARATCGSGNKNAQMRYELSRQQLPTEPKVLDGIVSFDGAKDYKETSNNENVNFDTGDLSISAWIKTTSTSGIEVILDKRVEATGPVQGYALSNYNGKLLLQLADGVADSAGNTWTNYVSNVFIADGNWHHVVVTVDRDQPDGGRWYFDGVEVGKRFNPTIRRGSLSNSKPLVIGKRSDNPGGFFRGEMASVQLFKRILSPQEIQAITVNKLEN